MKESDKKSKKFPIRKKTLVHFSMMAILLGLMGCSKDPLVKLKTSNLDLAEKKVMYQEIRKRNDGLKSFRSLAQVRLGDGLFSSKGQMAFAYIRPSWLKFDAVSDFAQDPQILVRLGDVLIYWPSSNQYFKGLATDAVMAKYFHFSMHPEQVGEILSGVIPLDDIEAYRASKIVGIEDHYLFRSSIREMIVQKKGEHYFPIRFVEKSLDGLKRYQVDYSDYKDLGESWVPGHVKVRFWDPNLNAEVWFSGPEINLPADKLDKKDFKINIPADATQIND